MGRTAPRLHQQPRPNTTDHVVGAEDAENDGRNAMSGRRNVGDVRRMEKRSVFMKLKYSGMDGIFSIMPGMRISRSTACLGLFPFPEFELG